MRTVLRWLGTALLFLLVAACFLPTLVPPFLDRIYYRGPQAPISTASASSIPTATTPSRRRPRPAATAAGGRACSGAI